MEKEEAEKTAAGLYDYKYEPLSKIQQKIQALAKQIREKKAIMKEESLVIKQSTKPVVPRTAPVKARGRSVSRLKDEMKDLGVDVDDDTENVNIYILL